MLQKKWYGDCYDRGKHKSLQEHEWGHSFIEHTLILHYASGFDLGLGNRVMDETEKKKILSSWGLHSNEMDNLQVNK